MKNRLINFYLWVYFPFMNKFVFPLTSSFNRLLASYIRSKYKDSSRIEFENNFKLVYIYNRVYKVPVNSRYFIFSLQRFSAFSLIKIILVVTASALLKLLNNFIFLYYIREFISYILLLINTTVNVLFGKNILSKILEYINLIFSIKSYRFKRFKRPDFDRLKLDFLDYLGFEVDELYKQSNDPRDVDYKIRRVKFRSFPGFVKDDFSIKDIDSNETANFGDFSVPDIISGINLRPEIKHRMFEFMNPAVQLYDDDMELDFYVNSVDQNIIKYMLKTEFPQNSPKYIFFSKFTEKFKFISIFYIYIVVVTKLMFDIVSSFIFYFMVICYTEIPDKFRKHFLTAPFVKLFENPTKPIKDRNYRTSGFIIILIFTFSCATFVSVSDIFCYDGYAYYTPSQTVSSNAPFSPFANGIAFSSFAIYFYSKILMSDYTHTKANHLQRVKDDDLEENEIDTLTYSVSIIITIATATLYSTYIQINSPSFGMRADVLRRIKKMYKNDTTVYSDLFISPIRETTNTLPDQFYAYMQLLAKGMRIIIQENNPF